MKMNEKLDIMLSRRHLKRVEFAESIGITYRAFAYYMTGSRKPRKSVLERMAAKLEVTPEFLLDDKREDAIEYFEKGIEHNHTLSKFKLANLYNRDNEIETAKIFIIVQSD